MKVLYNQSLIDIALQEYGSLEGLVDLAVLNGKSITSFLQAGDDLVTNTPILQDVVDFYKTKSIFVATGTTLPTNIDYNILDYNDLDYN